MSAQWSDVNTRVIESGVNGGITNRNDMKKIREELPMIF
jgi:hypothetical protein